MKKILLYVLFFLIHYALFAQDSTQPKWGISYCSGRVRGRSDIRLLPSPPLSKDWTYSVWCLYRIFYVKNISLQLGVERQLTRTFVYPWLTKYPEYASGGGALWYLGYTQVVYSFLPKKRLSPYLGIGLASRIVDFNTGFGEIGLNMKPKADFPLLIGLKAHVSRAFFSERIGGNFDYLDNLAWGVSVQYAFKRDKHKKEGITTP